MVCGYTELMIPNKGEMYNNLSEIPDAIVGTSVFCTFVNWKQFFFKRAIHNFRTTKTK